MTTPIPLADQIVEVEREIRNRARLYPEWIEKGRLTQAVADQKLAALRAVQSTLTWLDHNEHWIRTEAKRRAAAARTVADLEEDEAARLVRQAFPDAGAGVVGEMTETA